MYNTKVRFGLAVGIFVALLLVAGCGTLDQILPGGGGGFNLPGTGTLIVKMPAVPDQATTITVTLTAGSGSVNQDLQIDQGSGNASGTFDDLLEGTWAIDALLTDADGQVLHRAIDQVEIVADTTVILYLYIDPDTGALQISLTEPDNSGQGGGPLVSVGDSLEFTGTSIGENFNCAETLAIKPPPPVTYPTLCPWDTLHDGSGPVTAVHGANLPNGMTFTSDNFTISQSAAAGDSNHYTWAEVWTGGTVTVYDSEGNVLMDAQNVTATASSTLIENGAVIEYNDPTNPGIGRPDSFVLSGTFTLAGGGTIDFTMSNDINEPAVPDPASHPNFITSQKFQYTYQGTLTFQ